jgi:uncharacterized protein YjbI with pentapeptide repeats
MHGVDMHGASLPGADFRDANLENANLNGAALCGDNDDKRCANFSGARVNGADFRNVRWCEHIDRSCRPVTADELRRYGRNAFDGALLP